MILSFWSGEARDVTSAWPFSLTVWQTAANWGGPVHGERDQNPKVLVGLVRRAVRDGLRADVNLFVQLRLQGLGTRGRQRATALPRRTVQDACDRALDVVDFQAGPLSIAFDFFALNPQVCDCVSERGKVIRIGCGAAVVLIVFSFAKAAVPISTAPGMQPAQ